MADPDEALIEAIAEAIHLTRAERQGLEPVVVEYIRHGKGRGIFEGYKADARAAYAAMVEHLGLVEETERGRCEIDLRHHDDIPCERGPDKRRLVSRWTEVDHGSE